MSKKILVVHTTGMVGKSTATAAVLYPNLGPNVEVISVESLNQDASRYGIPVRKMRATQFDQIQSRVLLAVGNVIVDVGASNFVAFRQALQEQPGAISVYDAVVVITTPDIRIQQETITTIEALAKVGMQPAQLRVLFNRAVEEHPFETEFEHVLAYLHSKGAYQLLPAAIIYESVVHSDLASEGLSLTAMLEDQTDYRALIAKEVEKSTGAHQNVDTAEGHRLSRLFALQQRSRGVAEHLREAFCSLRLQADEAI